MGFPKNEGANIGLGIKKSFSKGRSLNKYATEFIDKYDGKTDLKVLIATNVWHN